MRRIGLLVSLMIVLTASIFAQKQDNLSEVISLLGRIKSNIDMLEASFNDASKGWLGGPTAGIRMIDEDFKELKRLLNLYDYVQEQAIRKQLDDLEQKYAEVILKQQSTNQQGVNQGNLVELMGLLGEIKVQILELEGGKRNILSTRISITTRRIQEVKDLLAKYDYPNKMEIIKQVNDFEQRFSKVVLGL